MSEEEKANEKVAAIPTEAVITYLSDLYRQLDSISFNIRTNITNMTVKSEAGEQPHGGAD